MNPLDNGFLVANSHTGDWCFCQRESDVEQVPFPYRFDDADQIKSQEQLIHALAHLAEKPWFDPQKFFACISSVVNQRGQ